MNRLQIFFNSWAKKFALLGLFEYSRRNFVLVKGNFVMFFIVMLIASLLFSFNVEAKTIVIEEIKIEGTIQKPEVMTFLSRARFTYRSLELNVSFINKVEEVILSEDAF